MMTDQWHIEATKQTPSIHFENHSLNIVGESYPENITQFSTPLLIWLDEYLAELKDEVFTVNIELIYFNSSSSKMLLDFFDRLENEVIKNDKQIIINWIYDVDNDSAQEYGEEFKEDLQAVSFNLVGKVKT